MKNKAREGRMYMRMYDLIEKKKRNEELTEKEISWLVEGYTKGDIPDYQMAAWLMAVYFNGCSDDEMTNLTMSMAHSGDMLDLSGIEGITADKHSTGGVGDKTTLIVAPIAAACGLKVAKMSGRGLGHTGGTIDKLESIPGFKTTLDKDTFIEGVNKNGLCVIGQSGNITPADKKIYALRDTTATVDSIGLIASSIMSKKLAAGSECIVLDVKTGSGAFMKEHEQAVELAKKMVAIGKGAGRKCCALITDMDIPLGNSIGNALEVKEALEVLKGEGPDDLRQICLRLSAAMLEISGVAKNEQDAMDMATKALESGKAFEKFRAMVEYQGGDISVIDNPDNFKKAAYSKEVKSDVEGYVTRIKTNDCGTASMILGAGREKKEDTIDMSAGIVLCKKNGDYVHKGDVIALMYTDNNNSFETAGRILKNAYEFGENPAKTAPLVMDVIL